LERLLPCSANAWSRKPGDLGHHAGPARRRDEARITVAVRGARRALRAVAIAERARHRALSEAAAALRRLVGEGLSRPDIGVLLGLSTSAVTRLLRTPDQCTDAEFSVCSTTFTPDNAPDSAPANDEDSDTSSGAADEGSR
jgi:hypothetical protein